MTSNSYHIAIIEDDYISAEILAHHLSQNPQYRVRTFFSGEAFFREENYHPDVVILDFHLDGQEENAMNGLAVSKQLKGIPTLILSQQQDLATAVELIQAGACEYIIKGPESLEKVEESLQKIIQQLKDNQEILLLNQRQRQSITRIALVFLALMISIGLLS